MVALSDPAKDQVRAAVLVTAYDLVTVRDVAERLGDRCGADEATAAALKRCAENAGAAAAVLSDVGDMLAVMPAQDFRAARPRWWRLGRPGAPVEPDGQDEPADEPGPEAEPGPERPLFLMEEM